MPNERKSGGDGAGGAKPSAKKPAAGASHGGGGLFDLDSEQSARLLLFGAVALVIAVAAGFLIFGYWYSVVKPRNRTVLQVADQKVSYEAMKRRMSYEFLQNTNYQSQQGIQALPVAALQLLENDLTEITQAEAKLGITVDDASIDQQLRAKLSVAADADQRQFADALRKALDSSGLNESDYRRIVAASAYQNKIVDKFRTELPASAPQAKVAVITTTTEDEANQAIARINGGEDFSEVAKAVSKETDVQSTGGVKDYATKESISGVYEDFAFTATAGTVSAPLVVDESVSSTGSTQYLVVKLIDRSDQPLTDAQKGQAASQKLSDWLKTTQDELRANGLLKEDWTQQAQADALASIGPGASAKLQAQQLKQQQDQQRQQDAQSTASAQQTANPQATAAPAAAPTAGPDGGSSPVAPSQPVAPDTNGQ